MNDALKYEPRDVLPPKEMILDYLDSLAWSRHGLAQKTGLPAKTISALCSGKTGITTKTAPALESAFGRPAHFWLNLQRRFDETNAGKAPRANGSTPASTRRWRDTGPQTRLLCQAANPC